MYKQTDSNILPAGWSTRVLGEIGQCLIGLTYDPKDVRSDGILVLRASNINRGTLQFDDCIFVNVEVHERLIVRENDFTRCTSRKSLL